jgi:membrane fusion protein, multidrug efflux system
LQIKDVATAPDPKTGEYRILLQMDKPEEVELPEGRIGTVTLTSNGLKLGVGTLFIPAISVMTDPDGKDYVWILDEAKMQAHRRDIRMGRLAGSDQVQVLSGLAGGERIIVAGVRQLSEGRQVRLWKDGPSSKQE